MSALPKLVRHESPAGPYWYHPDHPDCQDGKVLHEEPSDTPRTDAKAFEVVVGRYPDGSSRVELVVDIATCEQLERELAAQKAITEDFVKAHHMDQLCCLFDVLDKAHEALEHLFDRHTCDADGHETWMHARDLLPFYCADLRLAMSNYISAKEGPK